MCTLPAQARKVAQGGGALAAARPAAELPPALRDTKGDPPGLREQCIQLFEEWLRLLNSNTDEKVIGTYLVSRLGGIVVGLTV